MYLTRLITLINVTWPCSAAAATDTIGSAPLGERPYPVTLMCVSVGSPAQIGPVRTSSGSGAGAFSDPHGSSERLVIMPTTKNALLPTFNPLLTTSNTAPGSFSADSTASLSARVNALPLQGMIWIESACRYCPGLSAEKVQLWLILVSSTSGAKPRSFAIAVRDKAEQTGIFGGLR